MTLDANGNLALGTTTPLFSTYRITSVGGRINFAGNNDGLNLYLQYSSGTAGAFIGSPAANVLAFSDSNGTERARITSGGEFLFGKTSSNLTDPGVYVEPTNIGYGRINFIKGTASGTGSTVACAFYYNGTQIGTITNTSTATAYNTSSDYRLKENVQPMTGALAKVAALKPCTYTWKADGSDGEGFIAHELAEVVPDAVTGEKDAVNEDGSIKPQGIDTSFLVATLTAAIQEQQAMIDEMKAEIAALKGAA
jgi:hypothetical protein